MDVDAIIAKAGGPTAVARALGLHHTTVLGWRRVPAVHARELARLAGLHPSEVRPDVYDPPRRKRPGPSRPGPASVQDAAG